MTSFFLAFLFAIANPLALAADGPQLAAEGPSLQQAEDAAGVELDAISRCRLECRLEAFMAARDCRRGGGSREECRRVYEQTLADCLAGCEPTCEELCLADARQLLQDCLDAGGSREECFSMAVMFLRDCLSGCGDSGDAEDVAELLSDSLAAEMLDMDLGDGGHRHCRAECRHRALAAFRECRAHGGSREECRAVFRRTLERCLTACEPTCQEQCRHVAHRVLRDCLAHGGSREECARAAHAALERCLAGCEPSCRERCREEASRILHECIRHGGSREECLRTAREALEHCLVHCEP